MAISECPALDKTFQNEGNAWGSPSQDAGPLEENSDTSSLAVIAEQAKRSRLQDEISKKLEEIKGRIDAIMCEYENVRRKDELKNTDEAEKMVNLGVVEDSDKLYDLLTDSRISLKYYENLMLFIKEYEQKCEQMEMILHQLHDFFMAVQKGSTQLFLEQVASDEIDLEKTAAALEVALSTARVSVSKLLGIKERVDQYLAIVTTSPDTNKRRKKITALRRAKSEVVIFTRDEMEMKLQKSTDRCTQLQVQLEEKALECIKVSTINDELIKLHVSDKAIVKELEGAQNVSQDELNYGNSKTEFHNLVSQMKHLIERHRSEMKISKAELEFKKQFKNLVQEDIVFGEVAQGNLVSQMKHLIERQKSEMKISKAELEFMEQLKNLVQEDIVFGEVAQGNLVSQMKHLIERHKNEMKISKAELEFKELEEDIVFGEVAQGDDLFLQEDQANDSPVEAGKIALVTTRTTDGEKFIVEFEEISKQLIQAHESQVRKLQDRIVILEAQQTALLEELQPDEEMLSHASQQSLVMLQPTPDVFPLPPPPSRNNESALSLLAYEETLNYKSDSSPLSLEQLAVENFVPGSQQPVPYSMSMLSESRLSRGSSASQNGAVCPGRPVDVEWLKAYNSVMKFKENVITMMEEHTEAIPQLSNLIDNLKSMEKLTMDKKHDAQGQMTETSFSLAFLLHQIKQTLQECFGLMMSWYLIPTSKATWPTLATTVGSHLSEIDACKETIVNLSARNESLQIKLSKLQNFLTSFTGSETIMFSRLDMERNSRTLKTAVDNNRLSPEDFESLIKDMEEYLTIPTQRLAALAYRLLDKSTVSKLVQNLYRTCMSPRQAANVLEGIVNMDDKRQERHSIYMKMSAVQRNALAHSLTHDLREAEKQVGVMLIKPIFGTKVPLSQDLITPLPRSLPVDQHHLARTSPASFHGSSSSARQITRTDRTSAPQSRITRTQTAFPLLHRRQKQQEPKKDVCRASTANPTTCRSNSTPPGFRHKKGQLGLRPTNQVTSPLSATYKIPASAMAQWNVTSTHQENYIGSLVPGHPFSKVVELDLTRNFLVDLTGAASSTSRPQSVSPFTRPQGYTPSTHPRGHTPSTRPQSHTLNSVTFHPPSTPSQNRLISLPLSQKKHFKPAQETH